MALAVSSNIKIRTETFGSLVYNTIREKLFKANHCATMLIRFSVGRDEAEVKKELSTLQGKESLTVFIDQLKKMGILVNGADKSPNVKTNLDLEKQQKPMIEPFDSNCLGARGPTINDTRFKTKPMN